MHLIIDFFASAWDVIVSAALFVWSSISLLSGLMLSAIVLGLIVIAAVGVYTYFRYFKTTATADTVIDGEAQHVSTEPESAEGDQTTTKSSGDDQAAANDLGSPQPA